MKINKNLSRYVLDQNGDVFEKESGEKVELVNKTEYKLVTDEIFKSYKGKSSNIVRRFTRDQIVKIYNSPDSTDLSKWKSSEEDIKSLNEKLASDLSKETEKDQKKKVLNDPLPEFQFEILGVKYRNAKEASKAIGVSPNTITNRAKKGVEGYKAL